MDVVHEAIADVQTFVLYHRDHVGVLHPHSNQRTRVKRTGTAAWSDHSLSLIQMVGFTLVEDFGVFDLAQKRDLHVEHTTECLEDHNKLLNIQYLQW